MVLQTVHLDTAKTMNDKGKNKKQHEKKVSKLVTPTNCIHTCWLTQIQKLYYKQEYHRW